MVYSRLLPTLNYGIETAIELPIYAVRNFDLSDELLPSSRQRSRSSTFNTFDSDDLLGMMVSTRRGRSELAERIMDCDQSPSLSDDKFRLECLRELAPYIEEPIVAEAFLERLFLSHDMSAEFCFIGRSIKAHAAKFNCQNEDVLCVIDEIIEEAFKKDASENTLRCLRLIEPLLSNKVVESLQMTEPLLAELERIWTEGQSNFPGALFHSSVVLKDPVLRERLLRIAVQDLSTTELSEKYEPLASTAMVVPVTFAGAAIFSQFGIPGPYGGVLTFGLYVGYLGYKLAHKFCEERATISSKAAEALVDSGVSAEEKNQLLKTAKSFISRPKELRNNINALLKEADC